MRLRTLSLLVLAPAGLGAQSVRIPAVAPGLQLTWASTLRGEPDYETVITITGVDSAETRYRIAWNRGAEHQWWAMDRRVSNRVRRSARALTLDVKLTDPPEDRGSPQSVASGAVLRDLKASGRADLVLLIPSCTRGQETSSHAFVVICSSSLPTRTPRPNDQASQRPPCRARLPAT